VPSTRTRGALSIPERYRSGFYAVAKMSDASFDELIGALKRAPSFENGKELSAWVAPEARSVPPLEVSQIVDAFTALYRVRSQLEVPVSRTALDVLKALRSEDDLGGIVITDENWKSLADRVAKLLAMESLNVIQTKAQELKSEYEHEFCEARIFTDIRPVFGSNVADAPVTMLLVHMLKLGYHDSHEGRHRELFLSMDGSDLASLKAAIERAETKAKSIQSRLESAGLKLIDQA